MVVVDVELLITHPWGCARESFTRYNKICG